MPGSLYRISAMPKYSDTGTSKPNDAAMKLVAFGKFLTDIRAEDKALPMNTKTARTGATTTIGTPIAPAKAATRHVWRGRVDT
jgi:hypothetical protein